MKFKMTAACNPKNHDTWFVGYCPNEEIEGDFNNADEAQDYLNDLCLQAGTDSDPYYIEHGPAIVACDKT